MKKRVGCLCMLTLHDNTFAIVLGELVGDVEYTPINVTHEKQWNSEEKNDACFSVLNVEIKRSLMVKQGVLVQTMPRQLDSRSGKCKQPHKSGCCNCPPFCHNGGVSKWMHNGDVTIASHKKNMAY